jgi:putative ABC transport system ATP-binding protein
MIEFKDISKIYTIGDESVYALDHVDMKIGEGEFVGILGPSGSGKSTMMNIMGCLDMATSGAYMLDNQPIEEYSDNELATIRNKKIGFIFQSFNLLGRMTIEENVELPLIYQGVKASKRKMLVELALEHVDLLNRRRHTPREISGGQQQRAAIARAIATDPTMILADEPTGNLDQKTGREIMDLFAKLNEDGRTIILITHDDAVAERTNRSIRIMDGKITEEKILRVDCGSGPQ